MSITTDHKSNTIIEESDQAKGGDLASRNSSPLAKKDTGAPVPCVVRNSGRDAHIRTRTMSALPAIFTGLGILALFGGAIVFWTLFVPVDAALSAPAEVVFKGKRQTVQHLEGGIVEKILVKDGDMVQEGQALIVLEDKQIKPVVRMVQEQNVAERAAIARLEAESRGQNSMGTSIKNENKYVLTENRLFKARHEAYQNQVELMRIQISQIQEGLKGSQERLALKSEEITALKGQLEANQELLKDGYVTKTIVLDLQRVLSEKTGERESIRASIAGDKQRIAEYEQRILSLKSDRVQGAVSELKQSALRRIDQEERIRPLRDTLERQVIRAPVTGRVVGLKVSTVGGVVMPREPLMEIAPVGEALVLEAKIDMKDINEVKIGQKAEVTISAFDSRKTKPLQAKITYISDDRIAPVSSQSPPYYAAYLDFEADSIKNLGDNKLIPGMSANVTIAIAPRTAFDYMVDPIKRSARKALQIK